MDIEKTDNDIIITRTQEEIDSQDKSKIEVINIKWDRIQKAEHELRNELSKENFIELCSCLTTIISGRFQLEADRTPNQRKLPVYDRNKPGKDILISHCQGFGDLIMYLQYLNKLIEEDHQKFPDTHRNFIIELPGWYVPLLKSNWIHGNDSRVKLVTYPDGLTSNYKHLMWTHELPILFEEEEVLAWDREFVPYFPPLVNAIPKRILVCPEGNPDNARDKFRAIPPEDLNDLMVMLGSFVDLDICLWDFYKKFDMYEEMAQLVRVDTFLDMFTELCHTDLLITTDTGIAHLAGAMGKVVYLMLTEDHDSDWRWGHTVPYTQIYPTVCLFRQETPGDWSDVFDLVKAAIYVKYYSQ